MKDDFISVKEIIEKMRFRKKIEERMLVSYWYEEMDEEIKSHTRACYLSKGTLFIKVANSSWLHYLTLKKEELLNRLNQRIGERKISDIKFKIGRIFQEGGSK
jgi:predicted nucleic acid-binding Zn ribbon protein